MDSGRTFLQQTNVEQDVKIWGKEEVEKKKRAVIKKPALETNGN